jgi:thymidylate synthase
MLAREGRLHLIVQMRSNDVVWGLPYDIFLFTMLQEMLALRLGLGLGVYIHSVGSLHLYEKHFKLAENVLSDPPPNTIEMPKMTSISSLNSFIEAERKIRRGDPRPPLDLYWETLALALEDFSKSRKLSSNT